MMTLLEARRMYELPRRLPLGLWVNNAIPLSGMVYGSSGSYPLPGAGNGKQRNSNDLQYFASSCLAFRGGG